ncbi:MAG: AAA domain-containing protein, partial [Lentisphaeraceae bacterium]|nr:AAA domain-containing protein [Lentisphaeraceae bacterium]
EKRTGEKLEKTAPVKIESPVEKKTPPAEDHKCFYWDFDLCSTVLGNFNYRKMTLVRDYRSVLEEQLISENFTKIFSDKPKESLPAPENLKSFSDVFHVVPADPTQMTAIERARDKLSYIIQGPPGTGKSQTISNLIADFAARDKRVLFVCEKRAALDVVYHRLGQVGIKKLCCLIHDSQDDKKAFIHDLKDCYETLSKKEDISVSKNRENLVAELGKVLADINNFYSHLNKQVTDSESLNSLLTRAVELYKGYDDEIPKNDIPDAETFIQNKLQNAEFFSALNEQLNKEVWADCSFSILKKTVLTEADPEGKLHELLTNLLPAFSKLQDLLPSISGKNNFTTKEVISLIESTDKIIQLRSRSLLFLLDKSSPNASSVYKSIATFRGLRTKAENSKEKNLNWTEKLSQDETERAASIALSTEKSLFRFLMPSWWKLRKILNQCYNFSAHKLAPSWTEILDNLEEEYKAIDRVEKAAEQLKADHNFNDIESDLEEIDKLRDLLSELEVSLDLGGFEKHSEIWDQIAELAKVWNENKSSVDNLIQLHVNFADAKESLTDLKRDVEKYHLAQPVLEELYKLPDEIVKLIQKYKLTANTLEYEILSAEIDKYLNANPAFKKFDFKKIQTLRNKYTRLLKKLHDNNAQFILEKKSGKFSEHLRICNSPAAELSEEEKEFKKVYNRGRKELEHEFGKKMRYKSIRDLAAEDSGMVVKDLKPIWLMSPLSVSDTIPLNEAEFDAVIFDEASQIVIEEAIPTLYRSKQFIIVGDEKQLPPTNFFNARNESSEALNVLNADSLLSVAALNVPSTLLGWHYRSKNEWLIAFSNASFYKRQLLTVPEISLDSESKNTINVSSSAEANIHFPSIKNRPISFHFMENGIYENRKNSSEAEYIAQMVSEYLKREEKLTLGIVAFSEAQQDEIENSLEKLAELDSEFRDKYNVAQERTEDGHYEGLFVKNLENVQGDERDIMILSICYGKNPEGKMRMNFGPINQKGGQKRLNVIVTRARRHVAVVSSIKGEWISNNYNEGALSLKRYLTFAENISTGNIGSAESLLDLIHFKDDKQSKSVYSQFSRELDNEVIKNNVGTSDFKVPLGTGIAGRNTLENALFDVGGKHVNASLEMSFIRPALLENFGWNVASISAKDVYLNPDKVKAEFEVK